MFFLLILKGCLFFFCYVFLRILGFDLIQATDE